MGRDSTESGEDSDILASSQSLKDTEDSNVAADIASCGGKEDTNKRYPCLYPGCKESFRQFTRFTAHHYTHAKMRPFACDVEGCDKAYTSFPHVSRHALTGHNKILFYQDYMNNMYEEESIVIEKDEKQYKCTHPNCNAAFVRPNKLRSHERTHTNERPYICSAEGCLKSYTNPSHLKRHVQSVHVLKPISIAYKCTFKGCDGIFKTNQALRKHCKRKHEGLDYKCKECNAMFKKHKQLKSHLHQHSGILTFKCQKCDKTFMTERDQKRHEVRGHKVYHCSIENCTEGPFLLWSFYRKHMALKHRPDFICDICRRSFPFQFRLRMHKELEHNASVVKPWPCYYPKCPHTFKEKRYLSQHVRHVHEGQCFVCSYEGCGKTFHWKASLDRHLRLHTASRPLPRPRKKMKKRNDFGKPKISIATKLADIVVPLNIEKRLLAKETIDSEEDILINESGKIIPSGIESSSEIDKESEEGKSEIQNCAKDSFSDGDTTSSNFNDGNESDMTNK